MYIHIVYLYVCVCMVICMDMYVCVFINVCIYIYIYEEPYLNHPHHCDPHARHCLLALNHRDCYMRGCFGILEWMDGANMGLL